MKKTELLTHLKRLDACDESIGWLEALPETDAAEAWAKCDRVDWMLWLAGHCGLRRQVIDCACDFAARRLAEAEAWFAANAPQHAGSLTRAIEVARDPATTPDAAWSAARSAESAARSAARSAAWSAESAARSAARSAAWSAESAAWSAESAARSAARSAAWSAAWSAESAARSARSAAWSAAWSAESAERSWQCDQLRQVIPWATIQAALKAQS